MEAQTAQEFINSSKVQDWLKHITPYVTPHLQAGKPFEEAMALAFTEYRDFLIEMKELKTERSSKLFNAICESTYKSIRAENGFTD